MHNHEKIYSLVMSGIAVLAAGLAFLPGLIGMDGMDGGYALSFIAVWVSLSAALVSVYLWKRSVQLDRLLSGRDLLAHWTYTPAEWQAFAEAEKGTQLKENRGLWILMAGMCTFLGVVFWLFDREAGSFVLLVMVGITLLLAAIAFGLPALRRQHRQESQPGEAWLAPNAVYFDDVFVPWDIWESRLQRVELKEASGDAPACLSFQLTHIVSIGIQNQAIRVPVPLGRAEEARSLLEKYQARSRRRRS